jgi:hypothetical protein
MSVSTCASAGPYIANKNSGNRMVEGESIEYRNRKEWPKGEDGDVSLGPHTGYVEETANSVHVVASSGVSDLEWCRTQAVSQS